MKGQRLFVLSRSPTRSGQAVACRDHAVTDFDHATSYAGIGRANVLQRWDDPNEFWQAETWMSDTLHQDTFDSPSYLRSMADTNTR